MHLDRTYDAVVIGSGPNGLAAAIAIARAGHSVLVVEAKETIGGGTRSAELTLPGFIHDICSTIHSLGYSSPFFKTLPLQEHGLEWIFPPAALAHPLDDGTAVMVACSVKETSETLGPDAAVYRLIYSPLVDHWPDLAVDLLGPLPLPPRHPILLARFGLRALWPADIFARTAFRGERARALFAGMAGHSMMPFHKLITAAFGIVLNCSAHAVGWPVARGGSQKIADALASYLHSMGGEIVTGWRVKALDELPSARAVLFDTSPTELVKIAGQRLPDGFRSKLEGFRYGPGVFKVDFALDGPIPWKAKECNQAATLHLGSTFEEIEAAELEVAQGRHPEKPYVLLAQQTLFDETRAPRGKHTVWAYCHVPSGSTFDMTERIEAQIERYAPGFRDCILARHTMNALGLEEYNPNYVGGDINAGIQDIRQQFTRPTARWVPYSTPVKGIYLCSSSTPPGGGAHGMCGYHA
ncbi:MAG TPA: NAD(P)/FAD-dependent oxidoreductase, partial [Anaerolineales bacterium]